MKKFHYVVYVITVSPMGDRKQRSFSAWGDCYQDAIADVKKLFAKLDPIESIDVRVAGEPLRPLIGTEHDRNW